jgi:DUF1009 family protein
VARDRQRTVEDLTIVDETDDRPRPRAVGLLCGGGALPATVARALQGRGVRVVAVCIRGEADAALEECVDEIHWAGIAQLGRWIRKFKQAEVENILMVGGIRKRRMFHNKVVMLPDWRTVKFWYAQLKSREDHTILGGVAGEFELDGIRVASVVEYCPELLIAPGCLTRRRPDEKQWRDIRFGWPLVKQVAALQIGQCLVVKDRAVLAVEGIDGTDATLRRGGELAGGGAVAVKVAKEGHDERFDIPCIGPGTVDTLEESRIAVLAVEAGQTIVLERETVRDKADRAGISIVAPGVEDLSGDDSA